MITDPSSIDEPATDKAATTGADVSTNRSPASGGAMNEERVRQFEQEVAGLKVRGSSRDTERWLQIAAVVGLIGGVLLVLVGGIQVSGTTDDADQRAMLATATFIGLALTIAGTALYVRVSLGRLLRYWLVRLVHEHRSETDRLIDAIKDRGT